MYRYSILIVSSTIYMQVEECADVSILHITSVSHLDAGEVKCRVYLPGQEQARVPDKFITCSAELKVLPEQINLNNRNLSESICELLYVNQMNSADCEMCDYQSSRIIRGPQDVAALVGDRVLLKATYVGQPEPTITWTRAVSIFICFSSSTSLFLFYLNA